MKIIVILLLLLSSLLGCTAVDSSPSGAQGESPESVAWKIIERGKVGGDPRWGQAAHLKPQDYYCMEGVAGDLQPCLREFRILTRGGESLGTITISTENPSMEGAMVSPQRKSIRLLCRNRESFYT